MIDERFKCKDISKTGIETITIIFDNSQIPVHWVVKNVHVCWV